MKHKHILLAILTVGMMAGCSNTDQAPGQQAMAEATQVEWRQRDAVIIQTGPAALEEPFDMYWHMSSHDLMFKGQIERYYEYDIYAGQPGSGSLMLVRVLETYKGRAFGEILRIYCPSLNSNLAPTAFAMLEGQTYIFLVGTYQDGARPYAAIESERHSDAYIRNNTSCLLPVEGKRVVANAGYDKDNQATPLDSLQQAKEQAPMAFAHTQELPAHYAVYDEAYFIRSLQYFNAAATEAGIE